MTTMADALDKNIIIYFGWFPNLTRAFGNNGRRPRQKFVFGILLQLSYLFWHITVVFIGTGITDLRVSTETLTTLP